MKTEFNVTLLRFETLNRLPNSWNTSDFKAILEKLEEKTANIKQEEMEEMTMLALADNEPAEAATVVLNYLFPTELNDGQIQNLAYEMQQEKLWEEYAEIPLHERFFNGGDLLFNSFNRTNFPLPEAVSITLEIKTSKPEDLEIFDTNRATVLLKILAEGLPPNCLVKRLYKEQLQQENFPEAKNILWQIHELPIDEPNVLNFKIVSSQYWLGDIKYIKEYKTVIES